MTATTSHPTMPRATRRIVFQGLGALGVACALAGCGGGSDEGSDPSASGTPETGTVLAATDEVPVGGGIVIGEQNLVLTQPTEGDFKAFTASCTHQGTTVNANADGIECPLHGSQFSVEDGSATRGPATEPLTEVAITVEGDQILTA